MVKNLILQKYSIKGINKMINYSQSQKSIVLYDFTESKTWGQFGDGFIFCTYGTIDAPETMPNGSCRNGFNDCFYREYA
jgi:hypothetical protein